MVKADTSLADSTFFVKMAASYDSDSAYAKAADVVARGVAKFPGNMTLATMLGQEQLKAGQQQQAVATFRKILTVDPKAPNIRMMIARTYDEMKQQDSTLIVLHEAKAAGEDGNAVGGYALTIGNRLFREGQAAFTKAQNSKTSEDYKAAIEVNQRVMPWVTFADSTLTSMDSKNTAGFLMAVAAFNISVAAVTEAPKTKSCELAKVAQDYIMMSQLNVARGGKVAGAAVAQLMPIIPQIMTGADQMAKAYCK
ncbi:MAG: hypothetical protein NTW72_01960 [Gemmatimonadetes bacterium]|nr:hypothetical protein [Gemmatimonadota bacterium]